MADNNFEPNVNKRICEHMNQDHAASVLAMAMALDPTAKRARMASITKTSVTLDVVDGKDPKRRALDFTAQGQPRIETNRAFVVVEVTGGGKTVSATVGAGHLR